MRVIREGVFETNSSSTHSISISGGEYVAEKFPLDGGVCKVHSGEFGWEVATHYDAAMKASYCLTYAKSDGGRDADAQMLTEVLHEAMGCEVEFMRSGSAYHEWGYIDHQSDDVCAPAFESKETLRDFIFNPVSFLHTDNDNHE